MKLEHYSPTFRQVLFKEVVQEKTDSGLFLPTKETLLKDYSSMFEKEKTIFDGANTKVGEYVVVKIGKDCIAVQPNDKIVLSRGVMAESIELDNQVYLQVMEQQIIGYERQS